MAAFNSTDFLTSTDFSTAVTTQVKDLTFGWIPNINQAFVLSDGYFVFVMQLGFAMLTAGSCRAKSAKSICLKNIMDVMFGGAAYYLLGWAFAYGDKTSCDADGVCSSIGNPFIGTEWFAMSETPYTSYATFYFQYVFAISTATIVSGAVAERIQFISYAMYAFFICAWVYPVLSHWVWTASGWASPTRLTTLGPLLFGSGVYDTVGSGAVHMVGGVAGLAGAWVAGPRIGRFDSNGKPQPIHGHNAVYYTIGYLLLALGFFCFNSGTMAQIIAPDGSSFAQVVARCTISTVMGLCFGGITAVLVNLAYTKFTTGHAVWDLFAAGNGSLTGTIVITSGCAALQPWAAAVGGIVGGLIYLPSSLFMLHVLKIDDPVDAFTVHGVGGAAGLIHYAFFASKDLIDTLYGPAPDGSQRHWGCFLGGSGNVLAANLVWILVIFGWTFGLMVPFFYILKLCGLLRLSPKEEELGPDVSHHGGTAYPGLQGAYGDYESSTKGGTAYKTVENGHGKDASSLTDKIASLETELATLSAKVKKMDTAEL
ncbi:g3075 [Coccomyxa elongata]